MEKTHNLEVPGSSPGWSTLKKGVTQLRNSFFHVCVNNVQISYYSVLNIYTSLFACK